MSGDFVQIAGVPDPVTMAELRQRAASGNLTREEMKAVIENLREGRGVAQVYSTTAKKASTAKKPPKQIKSADELLKGLGDL